jgi:hypothetical protein
MTAPRAGLPAIAVSCAIMAHPDRAERAEGLRAALGGMGASIVYDPDPAGPRTAVRTAAAAWAALPGGATHHLVLQDDAEPVPGFAERLRRLMTAVPDRPISLFAEWGCVTATMVRWGVLAGADLVECVDTYVPTQGVVLPAALVPGLVAAMREALAAGKTDDDVVLREYLDDLGTRALVAVPHLVQHGDRESLMNHQAAGLRRATCLPGADDAAPTGTVLCAPGWVPNQTWSKGRAMCLRVGPGFAGEPTRRVLATVGAPTVLFREELDRVLAQLREQADLELHCGYALLHELWHTAVAIGVLSPVPLDLDRPSGARALITMAPGALRCFVSPDALEVCGPALGDLVRTGVELGVAHRTGQ